MQVGHLSVKIFKPFFVLIFCLLTSNFFPQTVDYHKVFTVHFFLTILLIKVINLSLLFDKDFAPSVKARLPAASIFSLDPSSLVEISSYRYIFFSLSILSTEVQLTSPPRHLSASWKINILTDSFQRFQQYFNDVPFTFKKTPSFFSPCWYWLFFQQPQPITF